LTPVVWLKTTKRVIMSKGGQGYKSFATSIRYIKRNRFLTLACVFVMSLSLLVFLSFAAASLYSNFILKSLEDRAQLTVFFKNTTPEAEILNLKKDLEADNKIEKVNYVSQDEALKIYLGQHQNEPTLLETVSANILPASLEIKTKKIPALNVLAESLKQREDVDEVVFFRDIVETFRRWTLILRVIGISFSVLMLLTSFLAVLLAVGISVKIRADEIEIMRLVGATDTQVIRPFLWQGSIYGLVSSLASLTTFLLVVLISKSGLDSALKSLSLGREPVLYLTILFIFHLLLGPFLGLTSAFFGVKKYLKV